MVKSRSRLFGRGVIGTAVRYFRCVILVVIFFSGLPVTGSCNEELSYTVQPGDTLQKLVDEYGVDSVQVEELRRFNRLKSTREIPPGTKIRFRLGWLKVKPLQVRALAVSGPVMVKRVDADDVDEVNKGDKFKPGEVLETGKGGSVMLEFGDGSRLLLQGNSIMTFEVLEAYGDRSLPNIRLHLHRGRIETTVAPNRSPNRRFEIKTPAGSAGARGTRFRVGADSEARLLRTEVIHGTVAVAGGGQELPVAENFGTVVEAGQAPVEPLPLLPGPDLGRMEVYYQRLPLKLTWDTLPGAYGYRVQIASASAAEVMLVDTTTAIPSLSIGELDDADYLLTVRAIDIHGLEGINASHRFTLDAHPLPPRLVTPASGSRLRHDRPQFQWQLSGDAVTYRFQLAANAAFDSPLVDVSGIRKGRFEIAEPLAPQRYYWRVASRDAAGEEGVFGDVYKFDIAIPPEPPQDISIRKTDTELKLQWHEIKPEYRYHLQLANDPEFSDLFFEQEIQETQITLPRPQQRVYMRMRTLDKDGYPGTFTRPVEIVAPIKTHIPAFLLGITGLVFIL